MSYVTNITIMCRYMDWTLDDLLLNFEGINFTKIDKYAGGGKVYESDLWAAGVNYINENYKDRLFNIFKDKVSDCYLYEQTEDYPARIFHLQGWGWKRISEDLSD